VTRSIVLEIAPAAGLPIEERTLYPEDLYTADEVLISSTNRGVIAVSEVHGNGIAAAPGPFAHRLEKRFADYVREYVEAHAAAGRC
jgi:branched-subunit amino acid aminotransferase/4-amino-4-deoxychorismate lyase